MSVVETEWVFQTFNKGDQLFFLKEKIQRKQTVNDFKKVKGYKLYNKNNTFASPIYTFSLAGNIIDYTPNQSTNRVKYFNHIF